MARPSDDFPVFDRWNRLDSSRKRTDVFFLLVIIFFSSAPLFSGMGLSAGYIFLSLILNSVSAAVSFLCFFALFWEDTVGLLCTGLYLFSVYRTSVYLIQGDMAELLRFAALPLVFYLLFRLWKRRFSGEAAFAALLFFTCALWYLLEALIRLFTRPVPLIGFQERGLYPAQLLLHFWTVGVYEIEHDGTLYRAEPMGAGFLLMAGFILFFSLWFGGALKKPAGEPLFPAKAVFLMALLLLLMSFNSFPWDFLQKASGKINMLLSALQTPVCFLSYGTLLLVILCGFLLCFLKERKPFLYTAGIFIVVIGIMTSGLYLSDHVVMRGKAPERYQSEESGFAKNT